MILSSGFKYIFRGFFIYIYCFAAGSWQLTRRLWKFFFFHISFLPRMRIVSTASIRRQICMLTVFIRFTFGVFRSFLFQLKQFFFPYFFLYIDLRGEEKGVSRFELHAGLSPKLRLELETSINSALSRRERNANEDCRRKKCIVECFELLCFTKNCFRFSK